MASVKHEHVVTIYQVGEDRGVPFLAMELLEGETLDDRLRREGRLPVAEAVRIGREIAEGLDAVHGRGLLHRDVKPANVWLEGTRGRVKILDFGLARGGDDATLTREGAIVGTPAFMAPEQINAEPLDARCDLFSLGCILYRMLTGSVPFKGKDVLSTLKAVATEDPPPVRTLEPRAPPALDALVRRLLSKGREGRPASARAVADELKAIERGAASVPSRRRWPALVAAALLVALAAVGAVVVSKMKPPHGKDVTVEPEDARSPLDRLKPESIPEAELRAAGGGDAKDAPEHLVAVFGKSDPNGPMTHRVAFTADGGTLMAVQGASGTTQTLRQWDLASGEERPALGLGKDRTVIAFSGDGKTAALRDRKSIRVLELPEGKEKHAFPTGDDPPIGLVLDEKGTTLAGVLRGGTLHRWDLESSKEIGAATKLGDLELGKRLAAVALSPDGTKVAARLGPAVKASVKVWDVKTGGEVETIANLHQVNALAFSPDSRYLALGGRLFAAGVWDTSRWKKQRDFFKARTTVRALAFSPDSKWLAVAGHVGDEENEKGGILYVSNVSTGKEVLSPSLATRVCPDVAFSPDGRHLAVANDDGTVYVFRLPTAREER